MSGIEQLRKVQTRILTQGNAGDANPPLPPPPVVAGPIFIMASFRVWNVENPATPSQEGIVTSPDVGLGQSLLLDGDVCWAADNNRNFSSVNITTPTAPAVLDQLLALAPGGGNQGLAQDGTTIYLVAGGNGGGVNFLDVINGSNPSDLSVTITYNLQTGFAVAQRFPRAIVGYVITHRLYIISAESGQNTVFAVYNATTPAAVVQQGTLSLTVAPAFSQACDLAISHPLVYALLGSNGTSIAGSLKIIDVTLPATPSVVSTTTVGVAADTPIKCNLRGTNLYILTASKIFTYDVTTTTPVLSATLNLTGLTRPATSFFVRNGIAYVGSSGDSEANAVFSIWSLADGLQFQGALGNSPVGGVALIGEL